MTRRIRTPQTSVAKALFKYAKQLEKSPTTAVLAGLSIELFSGTSDPVVNFYLDVDHRTDYIPLVLMEVSDAILWLYMLSTIASHEGV